MFQFPATRLASAQLTPPRLVIDLGLDSNLAEYNVPTADLPKIAELALGTKDSPNFPKVVDLLKSLYPLA